MACLIIYDMAFSAVLKLGDTRAGIFYKEFDLLSVKTKFVRRANGILPSNDCRCTLIEVSLIVPEKSNLDLFEWYINKDTLSGSIEMTEPGFMGNENIRTLSFEGAQCCGITQTYDIESRRQFLMTVSFIATVVTTEDVRFSLYPEKDTTLA